MASSKNGRRRNGSQPDSDAPDESDQFERFEALARKLVNTPKHKVDEARAEEDFARPARRRAARRG